MRFGLHHIVFSLCFFGAVAQSPAAARDDLSAPPNEEMSSMEQGFTRPGEPLYEALAGKRPRHLVADPLRFRFEVPDGSPSIGLSSGFKEQIERAGIAKTTIPDDGNSPTTPGYPGAVQINHRCGVIRTGHGSEFVQLEYRYEWRPIADTNMDGRRDKHDEHGWVLTSETWRAWPADTAQVC
ncbi:MAG: hypothetical protein H4O13_15075 [Xanthomonadales bacterium]|nr:hypothetical protein [Xanthomonadales bacterium]